MKKIKMWIELLFIFLLPLIFMSLSVKIETTKNYDENNNEISKLSNFTWEYPYNDFKNENHYINYFKFNQKIDTILPSDNLGLTINLNEDNTLNISGTPTSTGYLNISNTTNWNLQDHKYYFYSNYSVSLSVSGFNYITTNNIYYNYNSYTNWIGYIRFNITDTNPINYNNLFINIIDLTLYYGSNDLIPNTIIDINNDISNTYNNFLNTKLDIINEQEVKLESNNIKTTDYKYNYSVWGTIYNDIIIKNLYLTDNITTRFILTYTITWFIMFILWHTIYVPFDWLIHLVTPKQKE